MTDSGQQLLNLSKPGKFNQKKKIFNSNKMFRNEIFLL